MTTIASDTPPSGGLRAVTSDAAQPHEPTLDQMLEAVNDVRGQIIFLEGALDALLVHFDQVLGLGAGPREQTRVQDTTNFQILFEAVLDARLRPLVARAEALEFFDLRLTRLLEEARA